MVRLHALLSAQPAIQQGIGTAAVSGPMNNSPTRKSSGPSRTTTSAAVTTQQHDARYRVGVVEQDGEITERLKIENKRLREKVLQLEAELRQYHQDVYSSSNKFSTIRPDSVTVGKKLGQGSFGAVYRGQWRGIPCALKFIDQSVANELLNEVEIMDEVCNNDHPNICRMYGVVTMMGGKQHDKVPESWPASVKPPCLVMEYLGYEYEKQSYSTFVDYLKATKGLRIDEKYWVGLCGMLQGAARGMQYLHSRGVIHRDMKSLNLLLDSRANLKIADFGLARLLTTRSNNNKETNIKQIGTGNSVVSQTASTMMSGMTIAKGTWTHMAPEVMVSGNYNTAADIFSFGIVISEAIVGAEEEDIVDETRTPQFGLDVDKIKALLLSATPSGNNNKIALQLVDLAAQCCQLDPKKRPTAPQIVGSFQLILLEYQTGRLRHHHHVSNSIVDASVKAEVKAIENQASEKIFRMADKDGDGYLCFNEFSWLARVSNNDNNEEMDFTRQDFNTICEAVGADSSRGLSSEQLQKVYTKLQAGDALEDWLILHARRRKSP